tara:strand:- start:379 stop:1533 length:1155 start_codon:yes stop_codon:yes gene_type:complete
MSTLKVDGIRSNSATSDAITLASNGTCTAKITNNLSNRNLIINGAMQVSQRGTSFADSASGSYTLDRFNIHNSSGTPAFTITQDTDAPIGFNNSLKVACTTADASPAAGSFSRIRYKIEAQDLQPLAKGTASAKASTLSFYVKTNKTGVYTVYVYDDDNQRMMSASYTVSDTNWNRYTISIPADTTGAINDDNGDGFIIHWGLSLGSNRTSGSLQTSWGSYTQANEHVGNVNFADNTSNVWAITGVQLEVDNTGSGVATDFEHRSYAQELTLAKRYYQQYTNIMSHGYVPDNGSRSYSHAFTFPVEMRDAPTLTITNTGSSGGQYMTDGNTVTSITTLNSGVTNTKNAEWYPFLSADLANYRGAYTISLTSTSYQTVYKFNAEL